MSYSGLQPAPDGSVILFNRCPPGCTVPGDLYRMSPTGQGLGPQGGPGLNPQWAPDARRIGWIVSPYSGKTIVLTDPTGGAPDTVAHAEEFAWSPDGNKMAITYRPTLMDQEIGIIDLVGDRQRINLTNNPYDDWGPSWSPDGRLISFYSARSSGPGVYLMNADGTAPRLLTAATVYGPASWSPDGTRLAFLDVGGPTPRMRVVTLDGVDIPVPGFAGTVIWSPTGAHALMVGHDSAGLAEVYVATADFTSYDRVLVEPALLVPSLAWLKVP